MSKISFYYLHPLLAGSMDLWPDHLDRIAAMGFGAVAMAPPFLPGATADLFLTADHDRLDPRLGSGDAVAALARLAQQTRGRGLLPMLDVVADAVAAESLLAGGPYRADTDDEPPDPRRPPLQRGVARLCGEPDAEWWSRRLIEWADAGIGGFRCLRPRRLPAAWWREVIAAVRARHAGTRFMAWTLGLTEAEAASLSCSGFDLAACCSRGWDYRSGGYGEAVDRLAHLAPLVAMPEAPFERRLSRAFTYSGRARRAADRAVAFSAALGAGWLMPMGFEYGASRDMDPARDRPEDFARLKAEAPFDLAEEIAAANAAPAGPGVAVRTLSPPEAPAAALLLGDDRVVLVNSSLDDPARIAVAPLLTRGGFGGLDRFGPDDMVTIPPGGVRVLRGTNAAPVAHPVPDVAEAVAAPRIGIEAVSPSVDEGRFPAKRLVGDRVEVSADVIADGHDRLAAALLWRAEDEAEWHEAPMAPRGNDRWAGHFPLARLGRHLFTVLAWKDRFGNFAEELDKKHAAGQPIGLELEEGRLLILESAEEAADAVSPPSPGSSPRPIRCRAAPRCCSRRRPRRRWRRRVCARTRIVTRSNSRSTPSGGPPVSRAGTSCFRARRAAIRPGTALSTT